MKQNLKTRSANRVYAVLDGKRVGGIKSLRMSDDYSPDAATEIGDIHPFEYVPTVARHTLSVSSLVLFKGTLLEHGIAAENGDAMLEGLVFDIEVYGKDDTVLIRKYEGVSYASGDIDVQANQIIVSSGTFNALRVVGTAS